MAYLPGDRIVGLSKLARVVEHYACRPQVQERMTKEIASHLHKELNPSGVGVLLQAEHLCMTLRGAHMPGSLTTTTSLTGAMRDDERTRRKFFTCFWHRTALWIGICWSTCGHRGSSAWSGKPSGTTWTAIGGWTGIGTKSRGRRSPGMTAAGLLVPMCAR
ncbi:GTP cyclohydrolase I [Spirillospora sp. NPDC052242]